VLRLPDGHAQRLRVRSLVGLLPLCASTVFEEHNLTDHPRLRELLAIARRRHPELLAHIAPTDDGFIGHKNRRLLAVLNLKTGKSEIVTPTPEQDAAMRKALEPVYQDVAKRVGQPLIDEFLKETRAATN